MPETVPGKIPDLGLGNRLLKPPPDRFPDERLPFVGHEERRASELAYTVRDATPNVKKCMPQLVAVSGWQRQTRAVYPGKAPPPLQEVLKFNLSSILGAEALGPVLLFKALGSASYEEKRLS